MGWLSSRIVPDSIISNLAGFPKNDRILDLPDPKSVTNLLNSNDITE